MKTKSSALLSTLFISTMLTGCNSGSSKGTSSVVTNLSMTGSGQEATVAQTHFQKTLSFFIPSAVALTPPALEDANDPALPVDLQEAWIVVKRVQFKSSQSAEEGENDNTTNYRGPFAVDLLSNSPDPFGEIVLPEAGIRRVKMLLHKATEIPAGAPSQLVNNSIYLAGSVDGRAFSYSADDTTDFQVSGPNAIVPENNRDLLVTIRLAHLIKKIDLSSIPAAAGTSPVHINAAQRAPAANPCPLIHPTASDLYTCFRMGMNTEAKFGKDDGDMDLDSQDETVE